MRALHFLRQVSVQIVCKSCVPLRSSVLPVIFIKFKGLGIEGEVSCFNTNVLPLENPDCLEPENVETPMVTVTTSAQSISSKDSHRQEIFDDEPELRHPHHHVSAAVDWVVGQIIHQTL